MIDEAQYKRFCDENVNDVTDILCQTYSTFNQSATPQETRNIALISM